MSVSFGVVWLLSRVLLLAFLMFVVYFFVRISWYRFSDLLDKIIPCNLPLCQVTFDKRRKDLWLKKILTNNSMNYYA